MEPFVLARLLCYFFRLVDISKRGCRVTFFWVREGSQFGFLAASVTWKLSVTFCASFVALTKLLFCCLPLTPYSFSVQCLVSLFIGDEVLSRFCLLSYFRLLKPHHGSTIFSARRDCGCCSFIICFLIILHFHTQSPKSANWAFL